MTRQTPLPLQSVVYHRLCVPYSQPPEVQEGLEEMVASKPRSVPAVEVRKLTKQYYVTVL